ncbi:unnamed protein product [Ectocarpus sp. CCAP 1310/34]|nr:unnamed protein product [Ectocarpus sp. CCAP 1310/34]
MKRGWLGARTEACPARPPLGKALLFKATSDTELGRRNHWISAAVASPCGEL